MIKDPTRSRLHRRLIDIEGFVRENGLIDIEARLVDTKGYSFRSEHRGLVPSGEPLHDMSLRLVIDRDGIVRQIDVASDATPYRLCPDILPNYQRLVGASIRHGWHRTLRETVSGVEGCAHHLELLRLAATVFLQTVSFGPYELERDGVAVNPADTRSILASRDDGSWVTDGCHAYRAGGPIVHRYFGDGRSHKPSKT